MLKKYLIILLTVVIGFSSCIRSSQQPGRQYMADMVNAIPYEAGSANPIYRDGKTNLITNPFVFTKDEIEGEAKHLYTVNCAICHGDKGDGQGHLVQIDKFPPPPSYLNEPLLSLSDGQRYHTLMYGKNMMGSYASQLNHRERWLVLSYVKSLQDASKPSATTVKTDSTKTK